MTSSFFTGLGFWTRANPELCLLATRGKPHRRSANVRKLIVSPRREHSRKPDEAYARIEALCEGPYLEMFARFSQPGWDRWGLDADLRRDRSAAVAGRQLSGRAAGRGLVPALHTSASLKYSSLKLAKGCGRRPEVFTGMAA